MPKWQSLDTQTSLLLRLLSEPKKNLTKRTQGIVSVLVLPLIKNERLKTTYASITYHMKRMKEIVNQSVKVCLMLVSNEAA